MVFRKLLITGGAGFVGSNLAVRFRQERSGLIVSVLDNLKRRGSELNLPRLREAGVGFIHGDIRCPDDLETLPEFDVLIDCSAEPSVQAGLETSPRYVLNTNLGGTINCLEVARQRGAAFLFLSTSRIYPIAKLNELPFTEDNTRFRWEPVDRWRGFSAHGIAEDFPLEGARSFYGASKLACEQMIQEYAYNYGMRALINRCGILSGPWQMGKVDQGVVTLWVAHHYFQKPLRYTGFGGHGKQVRDVLHVDDLYDLLVRQMKSPSHWDGRVYNVGGGAQVSLSLRELTALCENVTGNRIAITPQPETNPVDVRIFLTDARKVQMEYGWQPTRTAANLVQDIHQWIHHRHHQLAEILG